MIHDEIEGFLHEIPEDKHQSWILKATSELAQTDPTKALHYIEYIREHFTNQYLLFEAGMVQAECYFEQGRYEEALLHYRTSLEIDARQYGINPYGLIHNRIGLTLWKMGEQEQALEAFFTALRHFTEIEDAKNIADVENNIGLVYWDLGMVDNALRYYRQSLEMKIKLGDEASIANLNNNIAGIYYSRKDYKTAIEYLDPVLDFFTRHNRFRELTHALNNKCLLLMEMRNYDAAKKVIEEALRIVREKKFYHEESVCLITRGDLETRLGISDEAIVYYDQALELAKMIQSKESIRIVLGHLAAFYEEIGDYEKALEKNREFNKLKDELFHEQLSSKIAELESRFDTEKKEREMEIHRLRNIELVKKNEEIHIQKTELENTLHKLQKAQKDIIALERKASAMAMAVTANHEINQPLMVIQGNMDMLRLHLDFAKLSSKQQQYVQKIDNSIARICSILEKFRSTIPTRFTAYSSDTDMVIFEQDNEHE